MTGTNRPGPATDGTVVPDLTEFRRQAARQRVVPVTRRLLADGETPVGLYRKLAGGPGTFLLESAEQGAGGTSWSRYSFVGVRSAATLTERDGQAHWLGTPPAGVPMTGDPAEVLAGTVAALTARGPAPTGLPPLTGGLVGYLGYDLVRRFERLPALAVDDLQLPELGMMLATDLVVLDHFDATVTLVANAVLPPSDAESAAEWEDAVTAAYHHAVGRLDAMTTALSRPLPPLVSTLARPGVDRFVSRTPAGEFPKAVQAAQEAVRAGECFQVVPSQRFERPTDRRPAGHLSRATGHQPQPVHVSAALRRLRRGRLLTGGALKVTVSADGRGGRCCTRSPAPARAARRRPRMRRWPPSCWPTPRSGPST